MNVVDEMWHKASPYLTTDARGSVAAVFSNHAYPARTLLISLAVLAGAIWVVVKVAQAVNKK